MVKWWKLGPGIGGLLALVGIVYTNCQAQAGMFCLNQSDCSGGLLCEKPPGMSSETTFGICQPARRGSGEPCLGTADCQSTLICSNELGMFNGDERHGICQSRAALQDAGLPVDMDARVDASVDASVPDQSTPPPDMATLPDLWSVD